MAQLRHRCPESSAMGRPGSSAAGSGGRRRRHHPAGEFGRLPRSRLTGPGRPAGRRPRSVVGEGRVFGACCFAGKLRSPGGPTLVPPWPTPLTPYAGPPTPDPTPATRVPLTARGRITAGHAPSGEWSGRAGKVRFARLIQRRGRDLGGPSARAAFGGNLSLPARHSG